MDSNVKLRSYVASLFHPTPEEVFRNYVIDAIAERMIGALHGKIDKHDIRLLETDAPERIASIVGDEGAIDLFTAIVSAMIEQHRAAVTKALADILAPDPVADILTELANAEEVVQARNAAAGPVALREEARFEGSW